MRNIPGTYKQFLCNCIEIQKSQQRNLAANDGKSIILLFNSNMYTNCEVTGARSVRENGSVDEAELNSPSAMISSSETS